MKRSLAAILVVALFGGFALAAKAPAKKAPADLCKNAIAPYEWIGQKTLFFKAAGKDNELNEKEFNADKTAGKGFVLSCEKWAAIVAFDKDGKKQIDWLEADAYRRDLRKRVLAAHDTSKDGKLVGKERTEANAALAAGKFASASRRSSGRGSSGRGGSPFDRPETIKQYDKDKDGKLNEAERATATAAFRARMDIRRYDTNRDGKLDAKETAARDKRRKEFLDRFDKNKNGEIDEAERGAIGEYYRNRRYDTNNDGKIDAKETAARDNANAEREKLRKEIYEKFDKNKNGQFDEDERAAVGEFFRNRRYDTNKDGKLDEKETAARDKASAERAKRRADEVKRFDKDGDGKLNEEEEKAHRDSHRGDGRGGRGRGGRGGGDRGGRGGGDRGGRGGGDRGGRGGGDR
jgi:Ca2+-binding EF-hand superfamily protein